MTEFFAPLDDSGELRASELHTSLGESLGAQAGEAFMGGTRLLMRGAEYVGAQSNGEGFPGLNMPEDPLPEALAGPQVIQPPAEEVPIADAAARIKREGLDGRIKLPAQDTIRAPVLGLMIDHAHERAQYDAAVARGPQGFLPDALGFITQLGVGMIDPVNIAAFSIPVMGEARYGMMLANAGESLAARAAVKAGVGAAQGALGGAALVPADWWLKTQDGQDYTMADALRSVVMSAGMGASFHAGGGLFGDVRARLGGRPLPGSLEDLRARSLGGDTHAAELVEQLGDAGTHVPEAALGEEGVALEDVPGIATAAETPREGQGEAVGAGAVEAGPAAENALTEGSASRHPAEQLADLPPRVQEDVMRASVAGVISGEPVRAAELLAEAAKQDPRIAESLGGSTGATDATAEPAAGIDNTHDVVSGANSSRDPNGTVYIDRRIPQFSPSVKDGRGQPANLWKYLAIHEREEAAAMARSKAMFEQENGRPMTDADNKRIYDNVHTNIATPAERAAVEADGVDWKAYTHEMDGYLAHIEHEGATNPPPDTHIDPQAAIGHHRSDNKGGRSGDEQGAAGAGAEPQDLDRVRNVVTGGRGPRARDPQTWSLLEYLASRGGIDPADHNAPDVRSLIGSSNKFIPGFGHLLRKGGMKLDTAREAAVEARYIHDEGDVSGGQAQSHVGTLLDAIDRELRGSRVYRDERLPEHELKAERDRVAEGNRREAERVDGEIDAALREVGVEPSELAGDTRRRVIEIMAREGESDPINAYERAVMEEGQDGAEAGEHERIPEKIPGWDEPDDSGSAPPPGDAAALGQGGQGDGGGGQQTGGAGAAPRQPGEADRASGRPGVTDFRKLARKASDDDIDLAEASRAADHTAEPESTDAAKAPSAAQAAAAEADKLLADILPKLSEDERTAFQDALDKLGADHKARETIVREGAACLAAAVM